MTRDRKNGKGKYLKYILHAAVLVGLVIAALKYINGEEVLQALRSYDYAFAPVLLALSTLYLAMKAWRFILLMRPVSDVPGSVLFRGYIAGTAATLVPGGVAARAGLMNQAGVSVAKSGMPVALSSILDQVAFIGSALFAAFWFESVRLPVLILLGILISLGVIFLFPAPRRWLERAAAAIAKRFNFADQWKHFLRNGREVINTRTILVALAITVAGLLVQVIMLDFSLRGFGLHVSYATLFFAYIVPTMLGRLSALPAGVGVTEASMVGFLSTSAGIDPDTGLAATAIFRIATVFFQALLGALVYFFAWRGEDENPEPVKS
ncbi:MAG TPA: lysylphosphatidylglycerol synthase transmembrane domain-containing protein [Anaerolineales bacterium]|nr:lysylphosphatidylglycerol synthase transmembrane domain-containing protein [Anaerolineales bacterium]